MNLRPRALRPGARVALVSPAGPVSPERIEVSLERCRALELQPVLYPYAGARDRFLAGTDKQRLGDLQAAFDDESIDDRGISEAKFRPQTVLPAKTIATRNRSQHRARDPGRGAAHSVFLLRLSAQYIDSGA